MLLIFSPNSEDFVTASHLGAAGRAAAPGPRAFAAHSSARWTRVSCGLGSVRSTEEAHHCHLGWRVWKWSGQAGRVRVGREWENTVLHQEQVPSAARCGPAGLGGASGALDTGVLFLDERPRRMFHSSHCKTDRIRSELLKILPVRSGVVVCVNWAGPPGVPEAPRHDPWAVSLGVRRGVWGVDVCKAWPRDAAGPRPSHRGLDAAKVPRGNAASCPPPVPAGHPRFSWLTRTHAVHPGPNPSLLSRLQDCHLRNCTSTPRNPSLTRCMVPSRKISIESNIWFYSK